MSGIGDFEKLGHMWLSELTNMSEEASSKPLPGIHPKSVKDAAKSRVLNVFSKINPRKNGQDKPHKPLSSGTSQINHIKLK